MHLPLPHQAAPSPSAGHRPIPVDQRPHEARQARNLAFRRPLFATRVFHRILRPSMNDFNAILGASPSPEPAAPVSWYRSMLRGSRGRRALLLLRLEGLHARPRDLRGDAAALPSGAFRVFDEMPVRDIASWNALISGLAQGHRPTEAISLYKRMKEEGLKPNEVTVIGALSACSQLGATREGGRVHDYITEEKLDQNVQAVKRNPKNPLGDINLPSLMESATFISGIVKGEREKYSDPPP
ncbi:pentatricopeptide repeat-containing protein At1g34160-like [Eucalyptus grandis]|uniref:pentatricopeptide repeat-containing protein At1g34160-like n=1 Tax=Eucalyptus grandis TaxID=71139 RepID=UPI00192E915B|nr:pentatricopeptide repeat-containing protein At1g34160-like [Eucalyptus grandis]